MTTQILDPDKHKNKLSDGSRDRTRWTKTDTVISNWLKERQELLVLFNLVSACQPFNEYNSEPDSLEHFCQILVDYISAGHFEIYEQLTSASELCRSKSPILTTDILERISKTTMVALDFHDQHESGKNPEILKEDLSHLGEHLAKRLEWEDMLLKRYLEITGKAA